MSFFSFWRKISTAVIFEENFKVIAEDYSALSAIKETAIY